jgi:hypothetical protein
VPDIPLLSWGGGGVAWWLKEEIPLEDRKKIMNSLTKNTGQALGGKYIFYWRDRSNSYTGLLTRFNH